MNSLLDATHDLQRKSWIDSANFPGNDFPIQNLPYGVFRRLGSNGLPHVGVRIGDQILDLAACMSQGLFTGAASLAGAVCADTSLNRLMALGKAPRHALRQQLSDLLKVGSNTLQGVQNFPDAFLIPVAEAELFLPATIGDYTDFYASIHHATHVGKLFRPVNPLLPNYKYVPIAYHGRSSSIVVSGTSFRRPSGQSKSDEATPPFFGPSRALDYEVELGMFVGLGNTLGSPVSLQDAEDHIFGFCLLNDWSARDLQKWEYQPLGPFLGKNFATTISPWVVTVEALAPFRVPFFRNEGEPAPLDYLDHESNRAHGSIRVTMEASIISEKMRAQNIPHQKLSRSSTAELYWTFAQMLTHHTSNGCNLRPGDLIGSGTISGEAMGARGCLLEMNGSFDLPSGESRRYLADGDEVILTGFCEAEGFARIGFGDCRGMVLPGG